VWQWETNAARDAAFLFYGVNDMPLPMPNEGESEQDFISRCMGNETMNEDFPEQEQRSAVCYRQWRESKGIEMDKPTDTGTDEVQIDSTEPAELEGNALKAMGRTDDTLTVGNYIVVFGGRDLEGHGSPNVNPDGSRGEYFTADTDVSSIYTKAGVLYEDWEHAGAEAGDDLLGIVDWKTAKIDDKGIFVERVLNRRNRYVQWLDELGWFDNGMLGTSSQADPNGTEKAADGQILRWPLVRDTITVTPMEPRMISENHLQAFKALGIPVPDDNSAEPEQEPEASPEAAPIQEDGVSAVDVARARARAQQILLSLEETQ
jgi:hypothetical protein